MDRVRRIKARNEQYENFGFTDISTCDSTIVSLSSPEPADIETIISRFWLVDFRSRDIIPRNETTKNELREINILDHSQGNFR